MKTKSTPPMRRLLVAAIVALAPAGTALAVEDCSGDPFAAYHKAFRSDGPEYVCTAAAPRQAGAQGPAGSVMATGEPAGAQGPAGPIMDTASPAAADPFAGYRRAFTAD